MFGMGPIELLIVGTIIGFVVYFLTRRKVPRGND
jgi:uncharacterized membrane-anchored protein YhcB (DUF1043 family)